MTLDITDVDRPKELTNPIRGFENLRKNMTTYKDEYEDNKVGTPMNPAET